eukprot:c7311_g1_i1.p1 GENE.c7311_g1_i1~~c7311_g1_i1.p1  ORF type:complete len:441 (-),score=90.12 c7311_g1_i1:69-1391(-)
MKARKPMSSEKPSTTEKERLVQTHPHYEFGGPIGAVGVIVGLPVAVVALSSLCTRDYCVTPSNISSVFQHLPSVGDLFSLSAFGVIVGWMVFQILLERFLPFSEADGVLLPNGQRLKYRISGHLQLWVSLVCVVIAHFLAPHIFHLSYVYNNFLQLAVAAIVLSIVLSVYLYAKSFQRGALLAAGGNTGNPVYDFFIGRELNPRIGSFDLKVFCELRPGLIGWAVINLAMAFHQHSISGSVSAPMILVNMFQGLYVWDALINEKAILTTMDVISDGFGYMLAFGDLAWVPFMYSIQARYLVDHDPHLPIWALVLISVLGGIGLLIFRGANGQKDAFRTDPNGPSVRHLKYMETKSGRKLLISGYWGMARKINYTGDWLMGLSWCLFCGFAHIIPYFYAIYFLILLIHRASRDNHMCSVKYGSDWEVYKKHVPCVFVPGIF